MKHTVSEIQSLEELNSKVDTAEERQLEDSQYNYQTEAQREE